MELRIITHVRPAFRLRVETRGRFQKTTRLSHVRLECLVEVDLHPGFSQKRSSERQQEVS
eukprot:scaffold8374_cov175-Amphora_coffeaeformis.AAC.8